VIKIILFIYIRGLPWMKYTNHVKRVFTWRCCMEKEILALRSSEKSYRCRIDIDSMI